jgi:hypothetical protein
MNTPGEDRLKWKIFDERTSTVKSGSFVEGRRAMMES